MRKNRGFSIILPFLPLVLFVFSGMALAMTGGPDSYGYRYMDSEESGAAPFSWIDISKTGTDYPLGNYDMSADIPIGFTFKFYGINYNTVRLSSSGFITFKKTSLNGAAGGEPIPTEKGLADNMIAAFWDNLKAGT